ncbi:MAG: EF-P beta-lysylation protein EpmB [Endozoicomonas sp. (ex Botrylloides leachii)]|nr:EF-P beta-lysylation protein EpmB [Endozoicomonas sp. (ex Botrylloides leachii)]
MITLSELSVHTYNWQEALSNTISNPAELLDLLQLEHSLLPDAIKANELFTLRVPRDFVAKMEKGNPKDPLLLQVLPLGKEFIESPAYSLDPLNESNQTPYKGVIHKYYGRLLLITTGACAINCRFCFRRHFPYQDNQLNTKQWDNALSYIASNNTIKEVILSGGDPLVSNDKRLARLVEALEHIPHVDTLRIHTRLPLMIPQRITETMLQWFTNSRLKPVMVIHCNHPNEVDLAVEKALLKLHKAGAVLLNQAVLLKGVNDSAKTLTELSQKLFQSSVMPYYLHTLDRVKGAAHFAVEDNTAAQLIREMMKINPGYLVPKLVREVAGTENKQLIPL